MTFIGGRGYRQKWEFPLLRGTFYVKFSKDASKFLNQILKQQQKGNSKAGLGMNQAISTYGKQP